MATFKQCRRGAARTVLHILRSPEQPADVHAPGSPSRSAMSSRICRSAAGPMFVLVVSITRSTLMVVGRCAWATPNPVTSTSVSHPRLVVVHGTTTTACCRNSSTSSEVTTMAGRTNPGSPRAGVPKSHRTMSPARISNVARRRVEHGLVAGIEWGACELSPDDAATLSSDQLLDLCVEGEPLTVSEPAQSIPSLDGNLDGSCIWHTKEYTSPPETARQLVKQASSAWKTSPPTSSRPRHRPKHRAVERIGAPNLTAARSCRRPEDPRPPRRASPSTPGASRRSTPPPRRRRRALLHNARYLCTRKFQHFGGNLAAPLHYLCGLAFHGPSDVSETTATPSGRS